MTATAAFWKTWFRAIAPLHDQPGVPPFIPRFYRAVAKLSFAGRLASKIDALEPAIVGLDYGETVLLIGFFEGVQETVLSENREAAELGAKILRRLEDHAAAELEAIPESEMEALAEHLDARLARLKKELGNA